MGKLEEALLVGDRTGEGALDVPEEVALEQIGGHRSRVDSDERAVGSSRMVMDGLGHELFARAALTQDQDVAFRRRRQLDQLEDLLHRLALADDVVEAVALPKLLLQGSVLGGQPILVQSLADRQQYLFILEGLRDVVEGALSHRFDGAFDGGEGGDHDDHLVGVRGSDPFQDLQPGSVGQHQVQQDELDLFFGQQIQSLTPGSSAERRVALFGQQAGQNVLQDLFVVDDQDAHEAGPGRDSRRGSSTMNRLPSPRWLTTRSSPPWRRTML